MSREGRLIKNTSILAFGTICTKGIMFFMTPLYTKWLSAGDYGTFDLITTYVGLIIPFVTLAIGEALFRFMLDVKTDEERRKIASTSFAVYCIGAAVLIAVSFASVLFFGVSMSLALAVMAYMCSELLYNYTMTMMRGLKHLDQYAAGNIIFVLVLAIATVLTVYLLDLGLEGILVGYAIGDIVAVVVMTSFSKFQRFISFSGISLTEWGAMLRYSMPMIPNAVSWWIINASDRTIVSIALGSEANAVYAVANKLSSLCTTIFSVFHLSWQQSASEALSDADRDRYYSDMFATITRVISSVCILVIGVNHWFFDFLFSEEYSGGRFIAPILAIAVLLSVQAQFIGGIYVALRWSKKNGVTTLVSAVVNIALNLALIEHFGLYAAAFSTLASYAVLLVVRLIDVRKAIQLKVSAGAVGSMVIAMLFALATYIPLPSMGLKLFILSVLCFFIMNRTLMLDFVGILRNKVFR